jgi:ribonuclease/clavin/mitogillin
LGMIRAVRHDDVVQLEMTCRQSRLLGFSVSAYLFRGVLIDTGFPRAHDDLRQWLRPQELRGAVVTHKHEDHAGNLPLLQVLGLPVAMSLETRAAALNPAPIGFYRRWTWGVPQPVVGTLATFIPDDLELVHTPGHSEEHHVVWDERTRTVFAGDLFLGVKVRVAHHDEDVRQLIASLRKVRDLEPRRLFDGHRGLVADPMAALAAKADWTEEQVSRITLLRTKGAGETEILRSVFGRESVSGYISRGDYSRLNFIRSVLAGLP